MIPSILERNQVRQEINSLQQFEQSKIELPDAQLLIFPRSVGDEAGFLTEEVVISPSILVDFGNGWALQYLGVSERGADISLYNTKGYATRLTVPPDSIINVTTRSTPVSKLTRFYSLSAPETNK